MRIIFICGSLEPSRDGVGDYVRRLAVAVAQQGHGTAAVALCDPFVGQETDGMQEQDGGRVPVLRLPAAWDPRQRLRRARA